MTPIAAMVERMLAAKVDPEMIALAVATCEGMKTPPKQQNPKASRLPSDWTVPADWRVWSVDTGLSTTESADQALRFKDYWLARPGKEGTKLDWEATWRNWCRSFLERQGRTKVEPSNGGWHEGLPTSEELRKKYATQGTKVGETASLVQDGPRSRDAEQGMVGPNTRKPGMGSLGGVLRQAGMDAASVTRQYADAGAYPGYNAMPVAGMALSDPRDQDEGAI